jgi:hypothetical protein
MSFSRAELFPTPVAYEEARIAAISVVKHAMSPSLVPEGSPRAAPLAPNCVAASIDATDGSNTNILAQQRRRQGRIGRNCRSHAVCLSTEQPIRDESSALGDEQFDSDVVDDISVDDSEN